MVNNLHLDFLREKISDLKTALFYSNSRSVLKLPSTIVTAINVDELGQIWLLLGRPKQNIKEFEQNFPVTLNFRRKGRDFFLNISGKATIVLEPGELDEMVEHIDEEAYQLLNQWMLVKVTIESARYHDNNTVARNNWISNLTSQVNKWISPTPSGNYKPLAVH